MENSHFNESHIFHYHLAVHGTCFRNCMIFEALVLPARMMAVLWKITSILMVSLHFWQYLHIQEFSQCINKILLGSCRWMWAACPYFKLLQTSLCAVCWVLKKKKKKENTTWGAAAAFRQIFHIYSSSFFLTGLVEVFPLVFISLVNLRKQRGCQLL